MRTNSKIFMDKVAETIRNRYPNVADLAADVESAGSAAALVEGGGFDCYYSQVADTMATWFDEPVDEVWSYYKDDGSRMWDVYLRIMGRNIDRLLKKEGLAD